MIAALVLIFAGAAILATLFLLLRQPVMLAYIALGMIIGPWGLGWIDDVDHIEQLSHIGIILLLFLIGLNLQPSRLWKLFSSVSLMTLLTSISFLLIATAVPLLFRFPLLESLIIGASMMFSSTIVGLKLLPTWTLHHQHRGEMMVSVLLMQDIIAIVLILLVTSGESGVAPSVLLLLLAKLLLLSVGAYLLVKLVVSRLFQVFDQFSEYAFLLSLGWGLLIAGLARTFGLSYEIGAFIAGVSFATLPVALPIADLLKPLRDFFLILFFFSIGAQFNYLLGEQVLLAGICLTLVIILVKPLVFSWGFRHIGESPDTARELGIRLGQGSEFSLLVGYAALEAGLLSQPGSALIQLVVIFSFVLSTYWVVFSYATPISPRK